MADIARLFTGDRVGKDTSETMERGMGAIRDAVGSERAAAQRENFQRDMADNEVGIGEALIRNKGALADQLLPTIGSMFIPVGVAGAAGKVATATRAAKALDAAALAARVAAAQKAAGVGATAAQNAASTFAELVDKGVPMQDAYVGAGITVPFSVVAGALTGGGAEVAAVRALTGTGAAKAGAKQLLKAPLKEGGQEMGEELGQIAGEGAATGEMPSAVGAGKQLAVAGTLGAAMGAGVDVATQAGQRTRAKAAPPDTEPQAEAPAAPRAVEPVPLPAGTPAAAMDQNTPLDSAQDAPAAAQPDIVASSTGPDPGQQADRGALAQRMEAQAELAAAGDVPASEAASPAAAGELADVTGTPFQQRGDPVPDRAARTAAIEAQEAVERQAQSPERIAAEQKMPGKPGDADLAANERHDAAQIRRGATASKVEQAQAAPAVAAAAPAGTVPGSVTVQAKTFPQYQLERGFKPSGMRKGTPEWDTLLAEWAAITNARAGTNPEGSGSGSGSAGVPARESQKRGPSHPASGQPRAEPRQSHPVQGSSQPVREEPAGGRTGGAGMPMQQHGADRAGLATDEAGGRGQGQEARDPARRDPRHSPQLHERAPSGNSAAQLSRSPRVAARQPTNWEGEGNGPQLLYSIGDNALPGRGLSVEKAQQAVQEALAGLASPPPIDIVARSEELGVDAPDGVMGAAIPGERRIIIVASAHRSAAGVVETLFHEMFHLGVRNVLPASDYVGAMLDLAKSDSRVQEYAIRWKKEAPDAPRQLQVLRERGYTGSELTAEYEALAIEEGLAVVAEELRARKQAGTRLGPGVRSLANWLATVAERMGMWRLAARIRKMTYNEAERFVLAAIDHAGSASRRPYGADGGGSFRAAGQTEASESRRRFGWGDAGRDSVAFMGSDRRQAPMFSRSPMKSVEANIARGRDALAEAVANKTSVHRAMFRNGMGWVDFVWGDKGTVKQSGKTKGAMGLSHILEARQRKDGLSEQEAVQFLDDVVVTIARGAEISEPMRVGSAIRIGLHHEKAIVWLTRRDGSNAWVVTAYERKPGDDAAGRATTPPTHAAASRTRDGMGAGSGESVAESSEPRYGAAERSVPDGRSVRSSIAHDRPNEYEVAAFAAVRGQAPMFNRQGDAQSGQQRSNRNEQRNEAASGIPAGLPSQRTEDSARLEQGVVRDLERRGHAQARLFRVEAIPTEKLPDALRRALVAFQRVTGTRVVIFRNLTPEIEDFNGVNFRDGVVYINETSQNPATLTAAHEWLHNLRRTDPALYQQLADEVFRQGRLPEYQQRLKRDGEPRWQNADVVEEELTAAAVSDALTDPEFLQRLAQRDPSAFRRVAQAFLDFLNTLTKGWRDQGSNAYLRDVQAFRDKLAEVLDALPQRGGPTSEAARITLMFNRGAASGTQAHADAITARWARKPDVQVVFDLSDPRVPEAVRSDARAKRAQGADSEPAGVFHEGRIYLLASQLPTEAALRRVLFHEALGHYGLRGVFGEALTPILRQIAMVRAQEARRKAEQYGLDWSKQEDRLIAAEEVLAEMAEKSPQLGFVRRAVAAVRTFLRQGVPGFDGLRVSDAEIIRDYILPARAWVERGAPPAPVAQQRGQHPGLKPAFSQGPWDSDENKARVLQGEPVAQLDTSVAPLGAPAIRSWAAALFEKVGGKAHSPVLGDVLLDERSVRSSVAHGRPNEYKVAAFAAVKDVLEKGVMVLSATHDDKESYYVSAPVRLSGKDHIVTALVHRDTRAQRMYLHSVATKENLLNRRVSRAGAEAPRLSGSNDSGDGTTIANQRVQGKASADQVADELQRLLMLKTGQPDGPMYSRGGNTGGPTLLPLRKPKGYGSVNEANGASHREALRHKRVA